LVALAIALVTSLAKSEVLQEGSAQHLDYTQLFTARGEA